MTIKHNSIQPIAITPGDPAGIGPDILLQVAMHPHNPPLVAIADITLLEQRAKQLNIPIRLIPYDAHAEKNYRVGQLYVWHVPALHDCVPGIPNVKHATYIIKTLEIALQSCLQDEFQALVTGPVNKALLNSAGIPFAGHTQFFTERCHVAQTVMMLATDRLRVALVTAHIPLQQVPMAITAPVLTRCLEIIHQDFQQRFALNNPRILVCGLNPHAGENGHLGKEEQTMIIPVLQQLRQRGFNLTGPVSADVAFTTPQLAATDIVLAMYHDQGLPVLKHSGFGEAVNVTLGLPFIRTSVDHGTAYDIAGTSAANPHSLSKAISLASQLYKNQCALSHV